MITFRQASPQDCGLIQTLACEVFPATYREILSAEQLDYMMQWMYSVDNLRQQMEEGHVYYLGYLDGEVCGYLSVQPDGEDLFHLQKIYVLPRFQGCGVGRALFEKAVAHVRQQHPGPCTLELNVNRHNPALDFYRRLGMRKVREGDFPIGNGYYMNDYIMALDLP